MEQHFNSGKIQRFIIIPIITILNDDGEPIREQRIKPISHFTANDLDLRLLAKRLEKEVNEQLLSKSEAPNR